MNNLRIGVCLAVLGAFAGTARADFITAYGWRTTEAIVTSATGASPGSLALATCHNGAGACTTANADVTFTTTGIGFSASGASIATWIASNTFANHNLTSSINISTALMDPTIWLFTGNASFTSPQTFTVAHDDGAMFIVNGLTVVNSPGPTAPITTTGTYTGPAGGSLPFAIYYAECCGGPAVLQTTLVGPANAPIPEPTSVLLLGSAALGVLGTLRKKAAKA